MKKKIPSHSRSVGRSENLVVGICLSKDVRAFFSIVENFVRIYYKKYVHTYIVASKRNEASFFFHSMFTARGRVGQCKKFPRPQLAHSLTQKRLRRRRRRFGNKMFGRAERSGLPIHFQRTSLCHSYEPIFSASHTHGNEKKLEHIQMRRYRL